MIILMADGSSSGNPGPIQIGFLVWDRTADKHSMTPVKRHSEFKGYGTNNEAEWMAIIAGLEYISRINHSPLGKCLINEEIYVYSDSQLCIKQLNGQWQIRHENMIPLKKRFDEINEFLKNKANKVYFNWIPRQLTGMADREATRRI